MSGAEIGMERKQKPKPKKRGKALGRLLIFLFIVAVTALGAYVSYDYVMDSHQNVEQVVEIKVDPAKAVDLEIPRGANTAAIAELLKENGMIKNTYFFKILSKINGYDGMYQSGTHKVSSGLSYDELMRILTSKPESIKVTIPEGYTYNQLVNELFKKKLIKSNEAFNKAANEEKFDYAFLEKLPQRENKLEGYLFPDTYEFDMNVTEKDIVNKLLRNFSNKFKEEYYARAKDLGMTVDQIIIMASIVEREAKSAEERNIIAGIFYNRLKSKDKTLRKLQSCATIQYIFLNKEGIVKERITDADTKIVDPYNTYQIEGLPPGPICNPGEASINAALYPDETDYLYFVAKGDGTHEFSKTYKEHQAATKKYGQN